MIKVGCCGFPVSKKKYYESLKVVEIQQTFYKLMDEKTIKKWRKEAPNDFEFTFKAFQGITHPAKSPTWKKSGISKEELKKIEKYVGELKWNKITSEYWNKMIEYSKILNSKIIVIQLPTSFKDEEKNIKNAVEFFENARDKVKIAVELRGWKEENKRKICKEFDLIDVVDLNISEPSYYKDVVYSRLHGKYENNKIIYKYDYSKEELKKIKEKAKKYKECYIMFNNVYMFKNALEFINL
jgi:uncharacterized protein YecE (DUF72 family)